MVFYFFNSSGCAYTTAFHQNTVNGMTKRKNNNNNKQKRRKLNELTIFYGVKKKNMDQKIDCVRFYKVRNNLPLDVHYFEVEFS